MLTLSQLVSPTDKDGWLDFILLALQGVYPVQQIPAQGTNQLQGTGTMSVQGPALASAQVVVKISTTGNANPVGSGSSASFQWSLDGGLTFNPTSPVSMGSLGNGNIYVIPIVNLIVSFANGGYLPLPGGYFVAGESYQFNTNTPTFPVTNWADIGVGNALAQVDSLALAELNLTVAQAIAGGFTQSWINPPIVDGVPTPPPDGWADLLAQNAYNRQRVPALQTVGTGVLSNTAATPYTIQPGQLFAMSAQGQVFTSVSTPQNPLPATLPAVSGGVPGQLPVSFQALQPGASYNNVVSFVSPGVPGGNYLQVLQTPLPGVSLSNPLQSTPPVSHAGTGSGVVAATATTGAGPSQDQTVLIRIVLAGAAGTAAFQSSLDAGASWSAVNVTSGSFALGAVNMTLAFSGSFVAGDTYGFSTSWITQYGNDAQSSVSLMTACQNQWPSLAPGSPAGIYENWAMAASSEVAQVVPTVDALIPGQVDIMLIGANSSPVSAAAIAAVTSYIAARAPECVDISVGTVTPVTIAVAASYIVVASAFRATAPGQIQAALTRYQNSVLPQQSVEWSKVSAVIQDVPGVIEITPDTLTLNGAAQDVTLAQNQTALITAPSSGSYRFV